MIAALQAHVHAMAEARAHGDLRTISGRAYPVAEGALLMWEAQQRELRRAQAAKRLKTIDPRRAAEAAFG